MHIRHAINTNDNLVNYSPLGWLFTLSKLLITTETIKGLVTMET